MIMEEYIITEKAFETSIIENLKKYGYPQESIITEYPISKNYRADIVVVDIKTQIPVLLMEVKVLRHTDKGVEFRIYEQLKKYYSEFNTPLKAIGAIFDMREEKVRYTDYTDAIKEHHYEQKVDNYSLPTYKELINGANQKVIKQKEIKKIVSVHFAFDMYFDFAIRCFRNLYSFYTQINCYRNRTRFAFSTLL